MQKVSFCERIIDPVQQQTSWLLLATVLETVTVVDLRLYKVMR